MTQANKQQLQVLKQGTQSWNAWRDDNPDTELCIAGSGLENLDLAGANLEDADLIGIPFRVTIGDKALTNGQVEIKSRRSPDIELVAIDQVAKRMVEMIHAGGSVDPAAHARGLTCSPC